MGIEENFTTKFLHQELYQSEKGLESLIIALKSREKENFKKKRGYLPLFIALFERIE